VGGIASSLDSGIEATLRRDRWVVAASLSLVIALAWLYLWYDAAMMSQIGPVDGLAPEATNALHPAALAMTFAMWSIMMVGMMLPSAAPTLLLYGALVRKNGERDTVLPAVWIFTGGYLAAWTAFSFAATVLQVALEQAALLTPMMETRSNGLSAAILIAAGVYQWLPLKQACLRHCRSPLQFLVAHWRGGKRGAFRMGAEHGVYCVGCCWALMLVLFVAGVMNLLWVALIAAFVLVEKLLPASKFTARLASVALIAIGLFRLI